MRRVRSLACGAVAALFVALPSLPVRAAAPLAGVQHATITLDGVPLQIESAFLPVDGFIAPPSGDAMQVATAAGPNDSEFLIVAIPTGQTSAFMGLNELATAGSASTVLTALQASRLAQGGSPAPGPVAHLFGNTIRGSFSDIARQSLSGATHLWVVDWVVSTGNRVWIVSAATDPTPSGTAVWFTDLNSIVIDGPAATTATTVPNGHVAAPTVPKPLQGPPLAAQNPTLWQGVCDDGRYYSRTGVHSYRLSGPYGNSFLSVDACGPGSNSPPPNPQIELQLESGSPNTLQEWQCVEYAMRFMWVLFHVVPYPLANHAAASIVTSYNGSPLSYAAISNPANPQGGKPGVWDIGPGDVLAFSLSAPYGHTAVVTAVSSGTLRTGSGTITIIQENAGDTSATQQLTVTGWRIQSPLNVTGWLHHGAAMNATKMQNTGSGWTEPHPVTGNSDYTVKLDYAANGQIATSWLYNQFAIADYNRDGVNDLWVFNLASGPNTTLSIYDGASGFQRVLVDNARTGLETTDSNWFSVQVADYNGDGIPDIWAIKFAGTGSGWVEPHIFSGVDFRSRLLDGVSGQGPTSYSNSMYAVGDYNRDGHPDLWLIYINGTGSGVVEPHVWDGANFQHNLMNGKTTFEMAQRTQFAYGVADYTGDGIPDVYAIKFNGTGSGWTELFVDDEATTYPSMRVLNRVTSVEQTDRYTFQFPIG